MCKRHSSAGFFWQTKETRYSRNYVSHKNSREWMIIPPQCFSNWCKTVQEHLRLWSFAGEHVFFRQIIVSALNSRFALLCHMFSPQWRSWGVLRRIATGSRRRRTSRCPLQDTRVPGKYFKTLSQKVPRCSLAWGMVIKSSVPAAMAAPLHWSSCMALALTPSKEKPAGRLPGRSSVSCRKNGFKTGENLHTRQILLPGQDRRKTPRSKSLPLDECRQSTWSVFIK